MKSLSFFLIIALLAGQGCQPSGQQDHTGHQQEAAGTAKSPRKTAMANIGDVHVHIEYGSPSVRNRIIWGGLVPFGEVWVTGAHMATTIHFMGDVSVAGTRVPEGKYGFFSIPGTDEWTLVLNRNWDQHLADEYDPADDVLRWTVRPDTVPMAEALEYAVQPGDSTISFQWERLRVSSRVLPLSTL